MITIYSILYLLGTRVAQAKVESDSGQKCNEKMKTVVSFVNVDSEIGAQKESLDDVPSLAVLANDPRGALPKAFSICSDIMTVFSTAKSRLMFFNLVGNDGETLLKAIMNGRDLFTNRVARRRLPTVFPNQWVRSCMAVDTVSGRIHWIVDGNLVENNTIAVLKDSERPLNLKGKIILGARHVQNKSWKVYSNKLTNLNVFSSMLPLSVMQKRTNGDEVCFEEGDYLAWSEMRWDLRGMAKIEKIGQEELKTKSTLNLYTAPFSRTDCKHFCKNLGVQIPSVSRKRGHEKLQDFCVEKMKDKPDVQWLVVDDIDEEGLWKDSIKGQPLNYTLPWADNEPNSGRRKNCAVFLGCQWFDASCTGAYHCLCESQPRPDLKFLGLCKETHIDRSYQPQNDVKDIRTLTIVGHSTSIQYDQNQMLWLMNVANSNVTGTSEASHKSFTLGKNTWTIFGDRGCNKKSNFYETELKMSGCKDGNFTCYDGQCVSMAERCDQVPNCRDHSDEKGCHVLVLEEGYNKRVPPVGKNEEGKLTPAPVKVSLTLFKVVDIREEDYSIELQIQINLQWKEIRATYHNLKPETYLNALSEEEIERLWLPLVVYTNTDQQETTRLGVQWEWSTYVSVKREGNLTRSGYEMVDETEIFKGNESTLIMRQSYTHEFQCIYQLQRYPFDTQVIIAKLIFQPFTRNAPLK